MELRTEIMGVDALLEESKWLRRLASHLVGDPGRAEDIVQETWVAVLRRGPGTEHPSRSWLAAVARNLARRGMRSEGRRRDRETLGAGEPAAAEDPADVTQRLDMTRVLAEELTGLPEPYRDTLYRRYYEGQSAQAIAQQAGVSAGTVRWRAAHGRELLKAALESRDGRGWDQWLAFLVPLAAPVAPSTALTASPLAIGALMTAKWILAGGLLGALTAGVLQTTEARSAARRGADVLAVGREAPAVEVEPAGPAIAAATAGAADKPGERLAAGPAVDGAFGVIGSGVVLDEAGEPIPGARVTLMDPELRRSSISAGAGGAWTKHGLAIGDLAMTVTARGFRTFSSDFTVPPGRTFRRDVRLAANVLLPVRFEGPDGEKLRVDAFDGELQAMGVALTKDRPGAALVTGGRRVSRSELGQFYLRDRRGTAGGNQLEADHSGVLECRGELPAWASVTFGSAVLEARRVTGVETELVFVVDPAAVKGEHGGLRVALLDEVSGAPITEGLQLQFTDGGRPFSPEVEGGELVFRDVPPCRLDLVMQVSSYEYIEREVVIEPGKELNLGTLRIGKRQPFEVHVAGEDGEPVLASVQALRPALVAGPWDMSHRVSQSADAQGVTKFWTLAPGLTQVSVGGRDGLARTVRAVDTSDESPVRMVVGPGTEVVFDLRGESPYPAGTLWSLEGQGGLVYASGRYLPGTTWLKPGEYTLRRFDSAGAPQGQLGFQVGTERLVVRAGEVGR